MTQCATLNIKKKFVKLAKINRMLIPDKREKNAKKTCGVVESSINKYVELKFILLNDCNFRFTHGRPAAPNDFTPNLEHLKGHPNKSDHSHLDPLTGISIAHHKAHPLPNPENVGFFHNASAEFPENHKVEAFCGNLTVK